MSRHTSPRRILSATPEQWAAWDEAARAHGKRWSTWARSMLDLHTKVMVMCNVRRGEFGCTLERGHRGPHYTGPLERDDDDDDEINGERISAASSPADIRERRRLL